MPLTPKSCSPKLGIRLESATGRYAPGDSIVGTVVRQAHLVSPGATIKVTLHGRTKSKRDERSGNTTYTYRGRFNLLSEAKNSQTLFEGPLHIPPEGPEQAWPFAVTIPTHLDVGPTSLSPESQPFHSYLSLEADQIAIQPLPDSFDIDGRFEAFVEYFLKAELRTETQGAVNAEVATLPVVLRSPSQDPASAEAPLKQYRTERSISSYRLIPEMKEASLSFSQKTKQFFGSSKVPTFAFNLELDLPSTIFLDSPAHTPVLVRTTPEWSGSSESVQGLPPKARLTYLQLRVIADTEVRCKENNKKAHMDNDHDKFDLQTVSALKRIDKPIYIPVNADCPPVDVGELIDLRPGRSGSYGQAYENGKLYPGFVTYNIKQTHRLKWEVRMCLADEEVKAAGEHKLTLLPGGEDRSPPGAGVGKVRLDGKGDESWARAPEKDAPPSFAQVQEDDALRKEKEWV